MTVDLEDVPMFDLPPSDPNPKEPDVGALTVGASITAPKLPGRWSVWSMSGEAPGAYFVVPADDEAKAFDVKYAVVKATQKRGEAFPTLATLRTDPHKELGE